MYSAKFTNKQFDGFKEVATESNGSSLTQLASFINHNCYRNAGKFFINDKGTFVVYANRPIKKNEQVNEYFINSCSYINIKIYLFILRFTFIMVLKFNFQKQTGPINLKFLILNAIV